MNKQTVTKLVLLAIVTLSLLLSACTRTLGGTSITVTMPHNDCGSAVCNTESQTDIIVIE